MGRCCGGKNAGKPITRGRYVAGLGVFCAYHAGVATALHLASLPWRRVRQVRDFHRALALHELREVLARRDIVIGAPEEQACEVAAG